MGKNSGWAIPIQAGSEFERRLAKMTADLEASVGAAAQAAGPVIQAAIQALANTGAGVTVDMIQEPQPAALSHAERLRNVSDKLDQVEARVGANNSEWVLTNNQLNRVLSQAQAVVPAEPCPVWICHVTGQQVEASKVRRMEGAGPESPGLYYLPMYGWAVAFPAGPEMTEWIRATTLRHYEMTDRQIEPVPPGMAWNPWHLRPSAQRDADTVAIHCLEFRGQNAILITHFNGIGIPGLPDDSGLFHTRLLKAQVGNRWAVDTDMEPLLYVLLRARTWAQAVVGHAFTLSELKNEAGPDGNRQTQIPQHNFPKEPPF